MVKGIAYQWDEQDEGRNVIVIVLHVQVFFETLDLCIADIDSV